MLTPSPLVAKFAEPDFTSAPGCAGEANAAVVTAQTGTPFDALLNLISTASPALAAPDGGETTGTPLAVSTMDEDAQAPDENPDNTSDAAGPIVSTPAATFVFAGLFVPAPVVAQQPAEHAQAAATTASDGAAVSNSRTTTHNVVRLHGPAGNAEPQLGTPATDVPSASRRRDGLLQTIPLPTARSGASASVANIPPADAAIDLVSGRAVGEVMNCVETQPQRPVSAMRQNRIDISTTVSTAPVPAVPSDPPVAPASLASDTSMLDVRRWTFDAQRRPPPPPPPTRLRQRRRQRPGTICRPLHHYIVRRGFAGAGRRK
ncbi:hypothetical protein Ga0100230_005755 [Opitutaceae bacterium TAV3]|nr:hypothetical protein Ga0100230_005755 [Opitutaceae bacterium TAV3]